MPRPEWKSSRKAASAKPSDHVEQVSKSSGSTRGEQGWRSWRRPSARSTPRTHDGRMGKLQQRNLETVRAFYAAGPAGSDDERRTYFADTFVWHVPGDTDLSGTYSGQ